MSWVSRLNQLAEMQYTDKQQNDIEDVTTKNNSNYSYMCNAENYNTFIYLLCVFNKSKTKKQFMDMTKIYFGGTMFSNKTEILNQIKKDIKWINISHINYEILKHIYDSDDVRILRHFIYNRNEQKIYKYTNCCVLLRKIIKDYYHHDLNIDNLKNLFNICVNNLNNSSSYINNIENINYNYNSSNNNNENATYNIGFLTEDRSIILFDISNEYIKKHTSNNQHHDVKLFYFQIIAYFALYNIRHIFPQMNFIFIVSNIDRFKNDDTNNQDDVIDTDIYLQHFTIKHIIKSLFSYTDILLENSRIESIKYSILKLYTMNWFL